MHKEPKPKISPFYVLSLWVDAAFKNLRWQCVSHFAPYAKQAYSRATGGSIGCTRVKTPRSIYETPLTNEDLELFTATYQRVY